MQTTFLHALRGVWIEKGLIEIQTPEAHGVASESRAELFSVDYFENTAYLAQSPPQFFKQMAQAAGFGGVFEVGPRVPRRPVVHVAARDRVHVGRHRDQLDRLA